MASRHALKHARNERRYNWMLDRKVLTYADDARARALAEAVHCPVCNKLVHPTNMKRHNELYHKVPLLCAVNPGSPLAPVEAVAAPAKVIQMPMPQMIVNKAKVSLIAMTITALVDAAVTGDYEALDQAAYDIQNEMYKVCGRDEALRGEYREAIRKELYSSETLEALEGVA